MKEMKRWDRTVWEILEEEGIPYLRHTDPTQEKISGSVTCRALGVEPDRVYKTALYLPDKGPWHYAALLLVPADRKVDLRKARVETGRKGRLASEGEAMRQGSDLSVLGL